MPALVVPAPTPRKQDEVDEDFDHAKPASQVPYTTFANWVTDYLRSFGEDDLAFLASRPEDPTYFDEPALGPHYLDTWAAMDAELAGDTVNLPSTSTTLVPPMLRRFKSENITNESLHTENVYLGPLGERLISAFRGVNQFPGTMTDLMSGAPEALQPGAPASAVPNATGQGASGAAGPSVPAHAALAGPTIKEMDALDFEARLTRELSFLGVLPPLSRSSASSASSSTGTSGKKSGPAAASDAQQPQLEAPVDWAGRQDDEISASLRACQRLLEKQTAINGQRRERLAELVRQRIAYQEYESLRDGLEAVIEGAWNKRHRAAQRKAVKDKKDKDRKEKDKDKLEAASLAQSIAALNMPQQLSATLVTALTKRRNLVDGFAHLFPEGGALLPAESIYEDLDIEENTVQPSILPAPIIRIN